MSLYAQRRKHDAERAPRQQLCRIPPHRRGDWVVLVNGRVEQVRSLVCVVDDPEKRARWRVCFESGSQCAAELVARQATDAEADREQRRAQA